MPKADYIPCLLQLLRQHGYDGATLTKISVATGLGKASLYHHFPGGKEEMVAVVLQHLEQWLEQHVLQVLNSDGDLLGRCQTMCHDISKLYESGRQPCVFAVLLLGSAREVFQPTVQILLRRWIDAIAAVLIAAGLDATQAQQRGEDAVMMVQGSLIVGQGLADFAPFQRVMQQLPQQLCRDLAEKL
jgi:TetR/AcrR family transcriptional regulator, lmrAB and yxaGH operons repressor